MALTKQIARQIDYDDPTFEEIIERTIAIVLEEAAKVADDFSWILPVHDSRELNETSDDAACAVQAQIATAIRAMKGSGDD